MSNTFISYRPQYDLLDMGLYICSRTPFGKKWVGTELDAWHKPWVMKKAASPQQMKGAVRAEVNQFLEVESWNLT